jgi:hypothetical protein
MSDGREEILNGCILLFLAGFAIIIILIIIHFFVILEIPLLFFYIGLGMMAIGGVGILLIKALERF